ncbi:Na(+)-translocating NADH-quinone reductase subunit C [Serratia microhaemolytica]|uniref:Na(+)-translocating NADH-quinone reductase subunit C n=1 Tax=Serratia microhaemolytica TaxID=2675110 RepID=UPI000FDD1EC0|nr:Na(+)-translocating NADH-quinone reductase subunit C [Serratia microhaemolytica]
MANESKNDSIGKTLLVVLLVCLVCSIVVAGSAVGLKSKQEEQRLLDKQSNILDVAGLLQRGMPSREIKATFADRIESRLLDLDSGEFVAGTGAAFNLTAALRSNEHSRALTSEQDLAGIRRRSNQVEIYLVRDSSGAVDKIILPIYGTGLWSMLHGFIALDADGNTVRGLSFYDHGETPGLGGEIQNPNWRAQWVGKQLFDQNGVPAIQIVKGGARRDDIHGVDGLSGATLTAKGVQNTFNFWLGELGFGPFLQKVRQGALKNG